jgi:hypothetical protein
MNSCTVLDPLGAQAVRRPEQVSERVAKMFCVSLLAIFFNLTCFLICCIILILSYTHDHFHLVEDVSLEMVNIVIDKVTQKMIKDAVKHVCLISTVIDYS